MVPLGDEVQLEARFGLSDIVLILTQDRCTVCVKHTIGEVGHVESHFIPFGDSVSVGAR